ncbi:alpha/beta fold hydrolase [Xanthobacter dioxanivorans]|uniref:Alpha/beta fold hydrolase n=1 Tax=Xanthobacter dioxanivorans TaxID=2528964 RepID=A0A974SJ77_9HYPH|nr:alpha/beta fold hydrolase [Xanthobacter dioxanivorans]QRG06954.1 alpha/beta fold hydrolase [Xanthobacter dioxanivorans]
MNWIEANGGGTRYAVDSDGPVPLVLIHEMGGALESWAPLLPLVAKGRTVLRYDMRGFGDASKLRGAGIMDELVCDLVALLDALSIIEPADLCGMAVGGAVALHVAARHPERVRRLALMGPALGIAPERRDAVRARADALEAGGMASIADGELALTYPKVLRDDGRFATYRARWLGNDPSSYAATYRMLAALDSGPALAAVRCPALLLAGAHDPLRPPGIVAGAAAAIARARFEVVPSGHVMAHQSPDLVAQQLDAFWRAA